MRAALLVVVAHAAALASLCGLVHAEVLHLAGSDEESEWSCAATVTDLRAENVALQEVNERQASELDEYRAGIVKQSPRLITTPGHRLPDQQLRTAVIVRKPPGHRLFELRTVTTHEDPLPPPLPLASTSRRMTLATPAPTPFSPIPTTATPSATPSASPVPTTEGITTHSQLAAAIANTDNSAVVIEGDVAFPPWSVIIVDSGRSVSVVGRSAVDGARVVLDGGGHSQHFWVTGGTLHIAFVNLVNGTAAEVVSNCRPDLYKCTGGSILVQGGGTLVMRSCDVRGGGRGVSGYGSAYMGAGVYVEGDYSVGEFYNVSFTDIHGTVMSALYVQGSTTEEGGIFVRLAGCQFLRNSADASVVTIGWDYVRAEIYDTLFANNVGCALTTPFVYSAKIVRCVFRENTGSTNSWPGSAAAVVLEPSIGYGVSIFDSLFERNFGILPYTGGALTVKGGSALVYMENLTFVANYAQDADDGGATFDLKSGARVTAINCLALANIGEQGGGFVVYDSTLRVINSKCNRAGGGIMYLFFLFLDLSRFCPPKP